MADPAENITLGIDVEPGAGDAAADQFMAEFAKGLPGASAEVNRAVASLARRLNLGAAGKNLGRDIAASLSTVIRSVKQAESELGRFEARVRRLREAFTGPAGNTDLLLDPASMRRAEEQLNTFAQNRERAFKDDGVRKALTTETNAIVRLLETQGKEISDLTRRWEEESRTQRETTRVAQQTASRIAKSEAGERVAIAQQEGAKIIAETRASGARRVALIQAFAAQIRAAERGLAAVFRGTSQAIGGLARSGGRALSGLASSFRRSNASTAAGLSSSLSVRERLFSSSFRRQESMLSSSITRQTATIRRFEKTISTGVLGAATGRSAAGAAFGGGALLAGGGGLIGLLTSGFRRFSELERIQKQFTALLQNEQEALGLIAKLKEFAKITPFDLVGVSDLAKGFLAIGFSADKVLPAVETIADAVALTGGGTDELVRIQRALGQVVSAGRLQGDELNQLAENLPGLNIRKILADQLTKGDTAELVEMQEAGEITGEMFVTGILAGLKADPRLAGAAQDLATTLSGRLANLKEQFADFGAAIIGLVAGPVAAAFGKIGDALAQAAAFVRGEELSETLDTIRVAASGTAIAIGGLLVAKVAGEALQILGVGLRAALTPLGLFVIAIGAIGALVAVALEKFPALRLAFKQIGDTISENVAPIVTFLQDRFDALRQFIETKAIPAIASFGTAMITNVLKAARRAGEFLQDEVLPRLRAFADFFTEVLVPEIQFRARAAFELLGASIRIFWAVAEPVIKPALEGIGDLVEGIGRLFELRPNRALLSIGGILAASLAGFAVAGPLGAAVAGAGATVAALFANGLDDELGSALSGIGTVLMKAIRPAVATVTAFLSNVFSGDNLGRLAGGFLNFAQTAGKFIGGIVSDPAFVAAIGAIVGFAIATGVRFAQGFIQGVIENIPELGALLLDAVQLAVDSLLNIKLPDIAGLFLAALGGVAVINAFRTRGQAVGKALTDGVRTGAGFSGGGVLGSRSGGFLSGVFGSSAKLEADARKAAQRVSNAFRTELDRNNRLLQNAGRAPTAVSPLGNAQTLRDSQAAIRNLEGQLGSARTAGLQFRSSIRDIGRALTSPDLSGQRLKGVTTAFGDLKASLAGRGREIGTAAGAAIAGSLGVAFSAQMVIEGQGIGDTISGIAGIIGSVIGATAIGGPVAGAAAAGLGIVVAGFQAAGNAAEKAKEQTQEYYDALASGAGTPVDNSHEVVLSNIAKETEGVRDLLIDAGFNVDEFARNTVAGVSSAERVFADLANALGQGDIAGQLQEGALTAEALVFQLGSGSDSVRGFADALKAMGLDTRDAGDLLDFLNDESGELGSALKDLQRDVSDQSAFNMITLQAEAAARALNGLPNAAADAFEARVQDGINPKLEETEDSADDLRTALDDAKTALQELIEGPDLRNNAAKQLDELVVALPRLAQQLQENLGENLVLDFGVETSGQNLIVDQFRTNISEAINAGIEDGTISGGRDLKTELGKIEALIKVAVPPGDAQDVLLGVVDELQKDPALRDAAIDAANAAADAGVDAFNGRGRGNTMASNLADGVAAGAGGAVAEGSAMGGGVASAAGSADMYGVGYSVSTGMAAGIAAGESEAVNAAIAMAIAAVSNAKQALGIASPSKVFGQIGRDIGLGLAKGISDSEGDVVGAIEQAIDAAIESARERASKQVSAAVLAARLFDTLLPGRLPGQTSDSDIQRSVIAVRDAIQAFADMRRATNDELKNLSDSIRESRETANEARRELAKGAPQRAADVFARGDSRTSIAQARNALGGLRQDLIEANREIARQIAEANKTKESERTAEQRRLAGQDSRSLSSRTAIGRQNRESILNAGGDIRAFAQQLLAAGRPVEDVVAEIKRMRAELVSGTKALGFNQDQVQDLLRSLGLTDEQLKNFRESLRRANQQAREEAREIIADANARAKEDLERLRELTKTRASLNPTTERGRETRSALLDALSAVREFGRDLLAAGTPVQTVVARMKELRNQIIANARAMGLNREQVLNLVRSMGLTNEQLNEFIRQLNEANRNRPAPGAPSPTTLPPPVIHIHPPYGDPEAIGLAAFNRVAAVIT